MCPLLASPVLAALVAGVLGILAVWLGLWRYRSEKWWERRAAAYAEIIESLHAIEDAHNEEIDAIEKSVQLPMERMETLRVAERDAWARVRKYASQGGFVITIEAAAALSKLTDALGIPQTDANSYVYYEKRAGAASAAIATIKQQAKMDLKT
jgi:hypothetical protein